MKILFSPVGMTAPVSPDKPKESGTYHEGALLQICRHYKPDLVYVYMSKESAELENEDHRYIHGLELLKKDTGQTFEIETIKRPELVDVHIFDYFLDEFKNLLKDIRDKHPDAENLVNVSSGTPAMKSALQILAAATDLDFLRALTPLVLEVFYNMAKKELKTDLTKYTRYPKDKYCRDTRKLSGSPIDGKFDQLSKYHGKNARPMQGGTYPKSYVLSWHISNLAENMSSDDKLVRRTVKIREFEENVRNIAAHTMTSFTKDEIKVKAGRTPEDALKELHDYIMSYTSIPVDGSTLTVYDEINKKLIALI